MHGALPGTHTSSAYLPIFKVLAHEASMECCYITVPPKAHLSGYAPSVCRQLAIAHIPLALDIGASEPILYYT